MFELKLTAEYLSVIDRALAEMPYRLAAPVVLEINKQINETERLKQEKEEKEASRNK